MAKKLTPLEALTNIRELVNDVQYASKIPSIDNELDIIENALKRLEIIDKLNEKHYEDTQKKLNALEIIKEHCVNVWDLLIMIDQSDTDYEALKHYNRNRPSLYIIDKKEFDLLKEVLK